VGGGGVWGGGGGGGGGVDGREVRGKKVRKRMKKGKGSGTVKERDQVDEEEEGGGREKRRGEGNKEGVSRGSKLGGRV